MIWWLFVSGFLMSHAICILSASSNTLDTLQKLKIAELKANDQTQRIENIISKFDQLGDVTSADYLIQMLKALKHVETVISENLWFCELEKGRESKGEFSIDLSELPELRLLDSNMPMIEQFERHLQRRLSDDDSH